MANRLFQEAREFVENVSRSERNEDYEKTVNVAKNALSSAFANSTDAEKVQLRELQEQLESHLK
jgi:hypothetical protein